MAFKFFAVPIHDCGQAEAELNGFLASHRVLAVDRRWVEQGASSFWALCVDYLEHNAGRATDVRSGLARAKIDYKEVLSPEDFAIFARLRDVRKEIAQAEAVPVYTIFTNDQLAKMVQTKATTRAALEKIAGVGDARIDKYGSRVLELLAGTWDKNDEAREIYLNRYWGATTCGWHSTRPAAANGTGPKCGNLLNILKNISARSSRPLREGSFVLGRFRQFMIHDPKERIITAPCFEERVLHHALVNVCEPEWEHGCRAGTKTLYHFGDKDADLPDYAWFNQNSQNRTHGVGEKKPNAFGLYDMHGNVWEWCEDQFDPKGPARVFRGGSWSSSADDCRAALRDRHTPSFRSSNVGFRLARVPSSEDKVAEKTPPFVPLNLAEKEAKKLQEDTAAKLKLPVEATNKIGMKLILIPPAGAALSEAYYLGKYEVTQGEWQQVMGYNPSRFGWNKAMDDRNKLPVEQVSWYDCVEFCNKLSEREGWKPYYELNVIKRDDKDGKQIEEAEVKILGGSGYHLPKEAAWEHGCRGGTKTLYHFGDKDADLPDYAWFSQNSQGRTHGVGEKKPNAFGLHDMHGNVWEWCEDQYYPKGGPDRAYRSGCWGNDADGCRAADRRGFTPLARSNRLGFRVARVPSSEAKAAEKPLPPGPLTASMAQKFNGHSGVVWGVALSSDGKHVLTGATDRTAILWEAASGKKIQTFQGHTGFVVSVALSGDGKLALTGSHDGTAILWDAASAKKIQTFDGHTDKVNGVSLSADGKHVLTGSFDKTAILWDSASAKKLHTFQGHTGYVTSVALSGDGKYVLTGSSDRTAILWDAAGGKKLQMFQGHTSGVNSVALSADGKRVLTGSGDRTAILWDAADGKKLQTFQGHTGYINCVAMSGDGNVVLTGAGVGAANGDPTARLWDAASGKQIHTFPGATSSVALSGDGKLVLIGSDNGAAILWEIKAPPPVPGK